MAPSLKRGSVIRDFTRAADEKNGTPGVTRLQTVLLELELATAFCTIAKTTKEMPKTDGNTENASQAFSEGVRFFFQTDAGLPREARHEVIQKLGLLNSKLRDLDERTRPARLVQIPSARASKR
jgi:hypothetical protein